ncbi:hypothetical protein BTI69_08670, partial [Lactobacillus delbrueckii subsp. bulgaricus]|nr:hypothetical protein [Lactobacillus delbrueckii subsp. bulgaricus]
AKIIQFLKFAHSAEKFFKDYNVKGLLCRCGLRKSKGIPLWSILFSNVFRDRSMYMQQKYGRCTAAFSKNTYYHYRFHAEPTYQLASPHYSAS